MSNTIIGERVYVLTKEQEKLNLFHHGTQAFRPLSPANIIQAAQADIQRKQINAERQRHNESVLRKDMRETMLAFAFPRKVVSRAANATDILRLIIENDIQPETAADHYLFADKTKVQEALDILIVGEERE